MQQITTQTVKHFSYCIIRYMQARSIFLKSLDRYRIKALALKKMNKGPHSHGILETDYTECGTAQGLFKIWTVQ